MTPCSIIPVIHYADDIQVMRNAERAAEAGCEAVMLIEMGGRNDPLLRAGAAIKSRFPGMLVGINHLGAEARDAVRRNISSGMASTWTDEQLTHSSNQSEADAIQIEQALSDDPTHAFFCAIAFKYQQHEPDPICAARRAISLGFIPTTSGPATGQAAAASIIKDLRGAIGPEAPLAIASGVTPENASSFIPLLSRVLVATGVSTSFHELDPAKLRALMEVRDRCI